MVFVKKRFYFSVFGYCEENILFSVNGDSKSYAFCGISKWAQKVCTARLHLWRRRCDGLLHWGVASEIKASLCWEQWEGTMCGEVQFEGAFDEGSARVSCSESSTSTKKITSGVIWKDRATIAPPANKYSAFQYMVILTSVLGHCSENILLSVNGK